MEDWWGFNPVMINGIKKAYKRDTQAMIFSVFYTAAKLFLGPFPTFRNRLIRALIMMENGRSPNESLKWLLDIHDFAGSVIDHQCVTWGGGVHIKHEIMDGIHSFFYTRIPAGSRVLDVGSGIGAVAHAIAAHADAEVIGIDYDVAHIRFASSHFQHPKLRYVLGDATRDLPSVKIDVIVMSSVLEHVVDRPGLLKALVAVYHPGKLLIRVPTFERHYHAALKKHLGLYPFTDSDHKIEYTLEVFLEEMKAAGLSVLYHEIRWGDIWAECVSSGVD